MKVIGWVLAVIGVAATLNVMLDVFIDWRIKRGWKKRYEK